MTEAQVKKAVQELLKGESVQDVRGILLKTNVKKKDLDRVVNAAFDFFEEQSQGKKEFIVGFCLEAYRDLYKAFRNGEGKTVKDKKESKNLEGALRTLVEITKLLKLLPTGKKPERPTQEDKTQPASDQGGNQKDPLDIELDELINEVNRGKG